MKCKVNRALQELFRKHRIFTSPSTDMPWELDQVLYVNNDASIEKYSNILAGNVIPKRMGAFSYSVSSLEIYMDIGRYCSIGPGVATMGSAHPTDWVTTSPFSFFPKPVPSFGAYYDDIGIEPTDVFEFQQAAPRLDIGHDVWIGAQALLRRDIIIGTGAVIGARTVVTKDVPDYAIVVGAPAKILRYRFPEIIIERLKALEWWRYGPDILQNLDVRDPEGFVGRMEQRVADGLPVLDADPLTIAAMRAVYPPPGSRA